FWLPGTELASSSPESGDQATVGELRWRRVRTFRVATSTTARWPLPVSKAIDLPSGAQPNTVKTLRETRARLLPPPAEIRRSASVFPAEATYAIFPPVGDHNGWWPTFTRRRRLLPFAFAVQMPYVFPEPLDASRSKATFVPSGERVGSTLLNFFPPA